MTAECSFTEAQKSEMLRMARDTIRKRLDRKYVPEPLVEPNELLKETMSCFVTLHSNDGSLRGCIGNIIAFEPLGENVRNNALNSAFHDPRFYPVGSVKELDSLQIEISVLTPLRKVESYRDIEIGRHGMVMKLRGRSAVFLPQVAPEQGWDLATTLTHLSMKAGLPGDAWMSEDVEFQVFEAIVFGENPR